MCCGVCVCVLLYDGDVLAKWLPRDDFNGDVIDDSATTSTATSTAESASSSCVPSPQEVDDMTLSSRDFFLPGGVVSRSSDMGKFRDSRGRDH